MQQIRLAVATRCFHQPLLASLKSAADLGAKGIQFETRHEVRAGELTETGRRDLLHQISEHGLTVASTTFPLNHPVYENEHLDSRVAAIRSAMKFAFALKTNLICIRAGRIPQDPQSKEYRLLVEILCDLARYSNHVGTLLAITPTNDSAESLVTLLDEVKTGPIGIDFDAAHFAMTGRPVADSLRLLHEKILHVQLRDGVHGIEGGQEEAVGQGNVDWIEVLALLGEMGYRGWMTAVRNQGTDQAGDMARGLKLIQRSLLGG